MSRKTIDSIHEIRMFIVQIVMPAAALIAWLEKNGKLEGVKAKARKIKDDISNKISQVKARRSGIHFAE